MTKEQKQFWLLLLIVFFGFVGISMPYLIFPALFLNPEYTILPLVWGESSRALFLGLTLAVYPLGQFIGSPILGSLSDDYGRKNLLAGSLAISAVCNLIMGLAIYYQHLTLLIISRFMAGIMEGNIAIARGMAADMKTLPKHKTFGKINAVISIGYLIGPLLGGLMTDKNLSEKLTTSTPFYAIFILCLILSILSLLLLEKSSPHKKNHIVTIWERMNLIKRMSRLFSNKRLQFLILISTAFTLAIDIFYEFGPVHLTLKWGYGPPQLVLYNIALCLTLAIGNGWLPSFFPSQNSNNRIIISCIGAFTLFVLGVAWTNSTLLMLLLFALCGLVIGLEVTLVTVKISNCAPDTIQGEVMGVQISLRVLGDALICLFGSGLLILSSKLILILSAIIAFVTMLCYIVKKEK